MGSVYREKEAAFTVTVRLGLTSDTLPLYAGSARVLRAPENAGGTIEWKVEGGTADGSEYPISCETGSDGRTCTVTVPSTAGKYIVRVQTTIDGAVYGRLYTVQVYE